jgi:hypothetical protein
VLGILFLIAPGTIVWRVPLIGRMRLAERLAFAFAAGILIVVVLMYAWSLLHIRWTRTSLGIPLVALAAFGVRRQSRRFREMEEKNPVSLAIMAIVLAVAIYAAGNTRETCGDLLYIWGPKATAFFTARAINVEFLAYPHYVFMHPDYPPLVPLVYAWGCIVANEMSWWGALYLTPLILVVIALIIRGFGASLQATALVMAVLAYACASAYVAGAADPFLILFECIAIAALTSHPDSAAARWIAAAAIAGASITKVEGAAFAIIVMIAFVLVHRRILRAIGLVLPAVVLLGSWILFARHYKLLDQYARVHSPVYWVYLREILKRVAQEAAYGAAYVPWLALLALIALRRAWRQAAFPLLVACGSLASTIYFYLHNDINVAWWIVTSGQRVMLTPLICVAVASAVTSDRVLADGVVP